MPEVPCDEVGGIPGHGGRYEDIVIWIGAHPLDVRRVYVYHVRAWELQVAQHSPYIRSGQGQLRPQQHVFVLRHDGGAEDWHHEAVYDEINDAGWGAARGEQA